VVQVTHSSSTAPGTITLSNLFVDVSNAVTNTATAFFNSTTVTCGTGSGALPAPAFTVLNLSLRVGGSDADATAVQNCELLHPGGALTVIVATDDDYQDALSASYLAGRTASGIGGGATGATTCVLITPTASLSPELLAALRFLGTTNVIVVGGPLAISPADITGLQSTQAYNVGGSTVRAQPSTGAAVLLLVQVIYGPTADATAADVDESVPFSPGTAVFPAAYGGAYNDTTGSSGNSAATAPTTPVATALLATDNAAQDAESASVLAFGGLRGQVGTIATPGTLSGFPLILTGQASLSPYAQAALLNLGVQQVILLGGPIAISDAVITGIQALGITVIRIAGQDATDTSQLLAQFTLNTTNAAGCAPGWAWGPIRPRSSPLPAVTSTPTGWWPVVWPRPTTRRFYSPRTRRPLAPT